MGTESPGSGRYWDVFRRGKRDDEVWMREGFQIEADTAADAAQRIADELPDHLLEAPFLVLPSEKVQTFIAEVRTERSRTITLATAEPANFNEHRGFRFPRWYRRKEQASV